MNQPDRVAIGLRAKTARAIVVVLGGLSDAPVVLMKGEIQLADPNVPATSQPYHEVMDLPWSDSQQAVRKYSTWIEVTARRALARLIKEQRSAGREVCGVGIVGAKDRDLARIGNQHIRAHAAEGVLFRRVLDLAAEKNGLKWRTFPDREFDSIAAAELGSEAANTRRRISDLRHSVTPPWRTDEKQAAIAAWLVLNQARAASDQPTSDAN